MAIHKLHEKLAATRKERDDALDKVAELENDNAMLEDEVATAQAAVGDLEAALADELGAS